MQIFPFDVHHFVVRMYFHEAYAIQGRVPGATAALDPAAAVAAAVEF